MIIKAAMATTGGGGPAPDRPTDADYAAAHTMLATQLEETHGLDELARLVVNAVYAARANALAGGRSYTCPRCAATSHNPNDAANGYCGACHAFTALW